MWLVFSLVLKSVQLVTTESVQMRRIDRERGEEKGKEGDNGRVTEERGRHREDRERQRF